MHHFSAPLNEKRQALHKSSSNLILFSVIPEIWIELYEAVNSGNLEKARNILEKVKIQELEADFSISPVKDQHSNIGCNTDQNDTLECNQDSEKLKNQGETTDAKNTKKDKMEYEGVKLQHILNQCFESYGETTLHVASRLGHSNIVRILLEAGGNPTVK